MKYNDSKTKIAFKAGNSILIYDLKSKQSQASHSFPFVLQAYEAFQTYRWIHENKLIIVTDHSLYHWHLGKDPILLKQTSEGQKIIDFVVNKSLTTCLIVFDSYVMLNNYKTQQNIQLINVDLIPKCTTILETDSANSLVFSIQKSKQNLVVLKQDEQEFQQLTEKPLFQGMPKQVKVTTDSLYILGDAQVESISNQMLLSFIQAPLSKKAYEKEFQKLPILSVQEINLLDNDVLTLVTGGPSSFHVCILAPNLFALQVRDHSKDPSSLQNYAFMSEINGLQHFQMENLNEQPQSEQLKRLGESMHMYTPPAKFPILFQCANGSNYQFNPNQIDQQRHFILNHDRFINQQEEILNTVKVTKQRQTDSQQEYVPQCIKLIHTEQTNLNVNKVLAALRFNIPIIIEGSAATGKTAAIQYCCQMMNYPLIRMNLNAQTQIQDLIGRIQVVPPGFSLKFVDGILASTAKQGQVLLLDEANLAPDTIISVIEGLQDSSYLRISGSAINGHPEAINGVLTIKCHPNFRVIMAQNSSSDGQYAMSRNVFSPSLMSHFTVIKFPAIDEQGIADIIEAKLNQAENIDDPSNICQSLMKVYSLVKKIEKECKVKIQITLRDILQALELIMEKSQINKKLGLQLIFTQYLPYDRNMQVKQLIDQNFKTISRHNEDVKKNYHLNNK